MSTPIACSLTGDELSRRLAEIRALGAAALIWAERHEAEAVLRFDPAPDRRAELERIVAAEATCCAFLRFDLRDEPDAVVLTIAAPAGGEPVLRELVDAFAGPDAWRARSPPGVL